MKKRPNFLLIMTDQHRADYLGCAGHPILKTPHIDSIAKSGVQFNRFYVSNPVCMPNRATLMTGRTPSAHGVRQNGIPLPLSANTFVEMLRNAGYQTGLVGKSHLQNFTSHPPINSNKEIRDGYVAPAAELKEALKGTFMDGKYNQERPDFWDNPDASLELPFYGYEHVDLCFGHGDECGGDYYWWLKSQRKDADDLIGAKNGLEHHYSVLQAWRTKVPEKLYPTAWIADHANKYIREYAKSKRNRPFYLVASFPDPHHPFTPPGKYWDMYKPEQMDVPEAYNVNDWEAPPHVKALLDRRDEGLPPEDGIMSYGINLQQALEARALTCGMISMVDDGVGKILSALKSNGLEDNTIVMFTSDHGDHLGDHCLLRKGPAHYRELVRVAFLWSDPESDVAGAETEALSGTIDISATVLDRARVLPFNGLQGKSLLSVADNPQSLGPRDAILIEEDNQRSLPVLGQDPKARTLITQQWRLSVYHGHDWGELYDLNNDPGELKNLWDKKDYRDIKMSLFERLIQEQIALNDTSPLPLGRA
tara:strand:+ start:246 stop:1850 length:1605 start_codon:yes stop_codon:yes gene_type:complete